MEDTTQKMIMAVSTYPDKATATKIATMLVKEGVAGCVNMSAITSVYSWKGEIIHDAQEQIAIFKTVQSNQKRLVKRIKETHPYDTPEVAVIPIESVNGSYLDWLAGCVVATTATTATRTKNS